MSLNLMQRVTVYVQDNPVTNGPGFLFEVEKGGLPAEIIRRDCVTVAKAVSPDHRIGKWNAVPYNRSKDGEVVTPQAFGQELYDLLRTEVPTVGKDGSIRFGDRDPRDVLPTIAGVAVKDTTFAQRVAHAFEKVGYEVTKAYR